MHELKISRIDVHQFQWQSENLGYDYNQFNLVYEKGSTITQTGHVLQIHID